MTNFYGLFPNNVVANAAQTIIFATPGMSPEWYAKECRHVLNGLTTHTGRIEAKRRRTRVEARSTTRALADAWKVVFEDGWIV